jgi:hypothetical protein
LSVWPGGVPAPNPLTSIINYVPALGAISNGVRRLVHYLLHEFVVIVVVVVVVVFVRRRVQSVGPFHWRHD